MSVKSSDVYDVSANPPFGRVGLVVRRWRNMRGFGVHSPAAFSLMKEVVRPDERYGLYSFFELDCLLQSFNLPYRDYYRLRILMRMLLRLCQHLSPSTLRIVIGQASEEEDSGAVSRDSILYRLPDLAGIPVAHNGEIPGLYILTTSSADLKALQGAVGSGSAVVLIGSAIALASRLFKSMSGGVRILMPEIVILLPISESAPSTYFATLT